MWSGDKFEHVININDELKDSEIWEYSKINNLTIISKDTDFSEMIMINIPPRVIHIKVGYMKINELHQFLNKIWPEISDMSNNHKLVRVFLNKLEGID